jgi:hypothetical protein
MCTLDACLKTLFERGLITYDTAMSRMKNPTEFHLLGAMDPGRKPSARHPH